MRFTELKLQNWKNFAKAYLKLCSRSYILGNNGTGKSNLMDALRFLRDTANPAGGLQTALARRGGLNRVRCLAASKNADVRIGITAADHLSKKKSVWEYDLAIGAGANGKRRQALVKSETVKLNGKVKLQRPNSADKKDPDRLLQTALEGGGKTLQPLTEFLQGIKYLHTVPYVVRHGAGTNGSILPDDVLGQDLMDAIMNTHAKTRQTRLKKISRVIEGINPVMKGRDFLFEKDKDGKPHLKFKHPGWRGGNSWQNEEILSDGELRLIGLLWTLLGANPVVLLEEPELSLNEIALEELSIFLYDLAESYRKDRPAQILTSTRSRAMLSDDKDVELDELIVLLPGKEGTVASMAEDVPSVKSYMDVGFSAARAALPITQSNGYYSIFTGELV